MTFFVFKDDFTAVKRAVIFDAHETEQQIKIHVNDEDDDEITENLEFSCRIIPVSDRVLITDGTGSIFIEQARSYYAEFFFLINSMTPFLGGPGLLHTILHHK